MNVIGQNIKNLRLAHNMSQTDLGNRIGKTRGAISQYENGETLPRMGVIEKLAEVFNVPKSEIIETSIEYEYISLASSSEREMLELYRTLPDASKQAVITFLRELTK